jgi:hypothetical protein
MPVIRKTLSPEFLAKFGLELERQRELYIAAHIKIIDGRAVAFCGCGHRVLAEDAYLVRTLPEVEERRTSEGVGFVPVQYMRVVCERCAEAYVENWRETKTICESLGKRKGGKEIKLELSTETMEGGQG